MVGAGETTRPEPAHSAPKCQACGALITGVYYKIPGLPEFYCEKCYQSLPRCFFCGKPVAEPPKDSVRTVCPQCLSEVITDPSQAQRLVSQVREWIINHLNLQLPAQVRFQFVEDLAPYVRVHLTGTMREMGAFLRDGDKVQVFLIEGMPRATLIETAAHELAHVWQNGKIPRNQRLLVKEGFAQWVAAKVLAAFECERALKVLGEREDLYGQGYRRIREVEKKGGVLAVIEYVTRTE